MRRGILQTEDDLSASVKFNPHKLSDLVLSTYLYALAIGVASITQYTYVSNKNSSTQGSSPTVVW